MLGGKFKRNLLAFVFGTLVIVVIVVLIIKMLYRRTTKDSRSKSVGILKHLSSMEKSNIVTGMSMKPIQIPEPISNLEYSPDFVIWKERLFPIQIKDVFVARYDLSDEIDTYANLKMAIRDFHRPPSSEELKFMIQYKVFMDMKDVYSLAGSKEIDQIYVLGLKIFGGGIEGDFVECGIWKGGMLMFMKALCDHYHKKGLDKHADRRFWGFDVFDDYPAPKNNHLDRAVHPITSILYDNPPSIDDVVSNFKKFDLMDTSIKLIKGMFDQSYSDVIVRSTEKENVNGELGIKDNKIDNKKDESKLKLIALLRIDCDYYDAVYSSLENLYWLISKGGFVVIDDYNNPVVGCKQAVLDFRKKYHITNPIVDTYGGSVYWKV